MNSHRSVWVVTGDAVTAEVVNAALRADGRHTAEGICGSLSDLVPRLETSPVPAVLVDIDPQPRRMLSALEPIISRFPSTRFVVLSSDLQSDLMLEAMQIGSRHFLTKPSIPAQLGGVLHRLIPNGTASAGLGSAITFFSASGGCGTTTLAVNLAHELQEHSGQPVLLVDLDTSFGGAGSYLGVEGRFGVADVLNYGGPIDAQLISTTAAAHSDRVHVLLSPATVLGEPALLSWDRAREAWAACRSAYPYCVIDAPRLPIEVAADLARASPTCFLVFQQTVKDIRAARGLLAALHARGVPPGHVVPLLNRYHRRGQVGLDDAQKVLGCGPIECVSNDFKSAIRALNYGEPLSKSTPRSDLRKDLLRLAQRIVGSQCGNGAAKPGK